jgi:protein-disulfide isomerase
MEPEHNDEPSEKPEKKKITVSFTKDQLISIVLGFALVVSIFTGGFGGIVTNGGASDSEGDLPRIVVSIDDDAVLGNLDAEITVIEFSDYQCPFCRRFWDTTFPQLKSEYIDTGKVNFVYRDFPLGFHSAAQKSGESTECAREQGDEYFWKAHDALFEGQAKQGSGTIQYTLQDIKSWVGAVVPDSAAFESCLDSDKYAAEVQKDLSDGQKAGARGTPAFFIGNEKDGFVLISGAQSFEVFEQVFAQI